jgi:hypothetical protein
VTTAPTSYSGDAYQKTGDASRRYLGSVKTNGSGSILSFLMQGNLILYREQIAAAPFRVLNGGTATTETTVNCGTAGTNAGVIPVTSRVGVLRVVTTATNIGGALGTSDDNSTSLIRDFYTNTEYVGETPLDSNQALTYRYLSAPSGALYIDVQGYRLAR